VYTKDRSFDPDGLALVIVFGVSRKTREQKRWADDSGERILCF
jgi:hypothetical protein